MGTEPMGSDLVGRCPFATAQRMLQGKWTILIMHHLDGGPLRFNELQRRLPKMTHATLSRQLKQMEEDGLVMRTDHAEVPPRVDYSLSTLGREFAPVLEAVQTWGAKCIEQSLPHR